MSSFSRVLSRAPRVPSLNSGLPVLEGWAPASKRAKSLLSSASAGRLPVGVGDDERGVDRDEAAALDVRRQRGHDLVVGADGVHDQHEPTVVVEDGEPGRVAISPREVDPDEVHGLTLP